MKHKSIFLHIFRILKTCQVKYQYVYRETNTIVDGLANISFDVLTTINIKSF